MSPSLSLQLPVLKQGLMVKGTSRAHVEVRFQCCELIVKCIATHRFRERYDYLATCLEEALKFYEAGPPRLTLLALQLARQCVGLEERELDEAIVVKDMLAPVVRHFVASGPRATLMNSVALEFFEHLAQGTNATLVSYIVEKHMTELEKVTYVDTFEKLKANHRAMVKNNQRQAEEADRASSATSGSEGDKRENAYWQDDDEDDDMGGEEPLNAGRLAPTGLCLAFPLHWDIRK